jgi:SNF2 family DNA or RNA helicase
MAIWYNLFYDKYAATHDYANSITKKVSINDLDDGSFIVYYDKEAYEIYMNKFGQNINYHIPSSILEHKLYKFYLYVKISENIESVYTVISINSNILKNLLKTKTAIPEINFLKTLCRYHNSYLEAQNSSDKFNGDISTNTQLIIKGAEYPDDYTNDLEIEQPDDIIIQLYKFQKCNINWMLNYEKDLPILNYSVHDEIIIGDVYVDTYDNTLHLIEDRKKIKFYGGGLIDEVGLGKTIQMIMLCNLNPSNILNYESIYPDKLYSRATLIICPNQLCGQWTREFKKLFKPDFKPEVISILTKRDHDKYTYQDILDADFVIVSVPFLDNKSYTIPWTSKVSSLKSFSKSVWNKQDIISVSKSVAEMGLELKKNLINTLNNTNVMLHLIHWHRLIVDEFHETYSVEKNKHMINLLPLFKSTYRWCMTATPFIQKDSILKTVNYLTGYTVNITENFLTKDNVVDFLTNKCFRKNTKKSIEVRDSFKLPPLVDEVMWLNFSATESMMYNSYLANPQNDKYGVYLRQLCCHPQLAEELKISLSNCKTLKDIEKMMISHLKKDVDEAQDQINKINKKIKKQDYLIKKTIRNLKKKQVKKEGGYVSEDEDDDDLNVVIDIDDNNENVDNDDDDDLVVDNKYDHIILKHKPMYLTNMEETLTKLNERLKGATAVFRGKESSYNFFSTVVDKLRNNIKKDTKQKDTKDNKVILKPGGNVSSLFQQMLEEDSDSDDDSSDEDDDKKENKAEQCGICFDTIPENDTGVTKCGHIFCFNCLKTCIKMNSKCPYCQLKLGDKDIYMLSYKREDKNISQEEKAKDELIDKYGTKIANLILYIRSNKSHIIIFSQWDDLLRKVGRILSQNNIKNIFCRGNVYQRDKAIKEFNETDDIRVIMLSSESAASGTNLTKASVVVLLDPIYGDYKFRTDQERQAIGRAYRMGQINTVTVLRLIIKNSVEEEIHKINLEENKKHIKIIE